jgi:signal transduction histidine kinase
MENDHYQKIRVNLGHLAREAVSLAGMHEAVPKHALRLEVESEPMISCHKAKLQQVLFNLIRNAADALESHGAPEIRITVSSEGSEGILSVSDNGSGIDPANLEQIWEPFFTTKGQEGTGLGLDTCRRIVEGHGGKIECENRDGGGTTFSVRIPLSESIQETPTLARYI